MANFFFSDVNNWLLSARSSSFTVLLRYGVGETTVVTAKSLELPQSLPDSTHMEIIGKFRLYQRDGRAVFGDWQYTPLIPLVNTTLCLLFSYNTPLHSPTLQPLHRITGGQHQ